MTFLTSFILFSALLYPVLGQSAISAYTPSVGDCPDGFALHRMIDTSNPSLSGSEAAYVSSRKSDVLPGAWKSYLSNVQATNSLPSYVSSILNGDNGSSAYPTLGIATSGGGYRAAIFGAGVLNALDGRNSTSSSAGTGGLLQAATYLAGLSGGSWLVVSLAQADFPTLPELVFGPSSSSNSANAWGGWLTPYNIFAPSDDIVVNAAFDTALVVEVQGKHAAGFPVTIADVWARALARHFVNGTNSGNVDDLLGTHGAGITFSSVADLSTLVSYTQPFPLIIADSQSPAENRSNIMSAAGDYVPLTNPLYEFNVYEMGSYDASLSAFIPTKYLGTTNSTSCVTGFDQASFIQGTSAELFNSYNISLQALLNSTVGPFIKNLNTTIPQSGVELDVASYPNPFYGLASDTYIDSNQEYLSLVDGGEDGEVVPIQPLLVKARGVDVIFAIDATNDKNNYADGSSLVASQNRSSFFPSAYSFPTVPDSTDIFARDNLTAHPTFFGCNATSPTPLLIYLPNGAAPLGQPSVTNTSTMQLQYDYAQVQAMLDQTFEMATLEGADAQWPACLACAVVERARVRVGGVERSGVCASCLERYCWYGSSSSGAVSSSRVLMGTNWLNYVSLVIMIVITLI